MVNILQVIYGMNIGGAETFIYNVLSNLDMDKYHVDFVIQDNNIENKKLYCLCKSRGCHIYIVSSFHKNFPRYIKEMIEIMQMPYDIVHIHANALINIAPILIAKKNNKKIVLHSHNTNNNSGGKIGEIIHYINRSYLKHIETINVACGDLAGKWMFGNKDYVLLNNAIPIDTYCFNSEKRKEIREQYHIEDKIVVGHVGRFVKAKNHEFILYIFSVLLKTHDNTVLMLVGDGPLMQEMVQKVKELSITNHVIFAGNQTEINAFYNAFDCLLFPSRFEGLPFAVIEAQANGLPIVASDQVTKELDLTGNIVFLSLDDKIEIWTKAIEEAVHPVDRSSYAELIRTTGYNVKTLVKRTMKLYQIDTNSCDMKDRG